MNRPRRIFQAAAITAAVALQVHRDRAHRAAADRHEADNECQQADIDILKAHCGIVSDAVLEENLRVDEICDALQEQLTPEDREHLAAIMDLFPDGGQS
jgi:hypothetical protein